MKLIARGVYTLRGRYSRIDRGIKSSVENLGVWNCNQGVCLLRLLFHSLKKMRVIPTLKVYVEEGPCLQLMFKCLSK